MEPKEARFLPRLSWYIWAIGLAIALLLLMLINRAAVNTPFQDELLFSSLYKWLAEDSMPSIHALIAAHNGHPFLTVKTLIAMTMLLRLPWSWMMYAQVVLLFSAFVVASIQMPSVDLKRRLMGTFVLAILIMTPRQWENLYWAMQIAFPLSLLSSLVSFHFIARYIRVGETRALAWGLTSGLFAVVSNGAGLISLAVVSIASLVGRFRVRDILLTVVGFGTALLVFLMAQHWAERSGIGQGSLDLIIAVDHGLRMNAHAWFDAASFRLPAAVCGVAFVGLIIYCVALTAWQWRSYFFELQCIFAGTLLILGITYARVTAGIFQPDAPRYIPLLVLVCVGCVLTLLKRGKMLLLTGLMVICSIGFVVSMHSEWKLAPSRQQSMKQAHTWLCQEGKVHPVHNLRTPDLELSLVRAIFCQNAASQVIRHRSLRDDFASGYFAEEAQTWISPDFRITLTQLPYGQVLVVGWIPDVSSYPSDRLELRIYADDLLVQESVVTTTGEFTISGFLPDGARKLRILSEQRTAVGGDRRPLSWVLVNIRFLGLSHKTP